MITNQIEEQISTIDDQLPAIEGLLINIDLQIHTEEIHFDSDQLLHVSNQLSSLRKDLFDLDHQLDNIGHPEINDILAKIDQILPEKGQPMQIRRSMTSIKNILERNDHLDKTKHQLSRIRNVLHETNLSSQIEDRLVEIEIILDQASKSSMTKQTLSFLNDYRSQVRHHAHKLEKLIRFSKEYVSQNYRFYITFRTRPLMSKPVLESMIAEWSRRLNKKFLGQNYFKPEFKDCRIEGLICFETFPDVHAHALIRPICPANYYLDESILIEHFEKLWCDQNDDLTDQKLKSCINPEGDILIERNRSSMDVYRRLLYSMKQSDEFLSSIPLSELRSPVDLGFKYLSDLDRSRFRTKPDKEKARFYTTKLRPSQKSSAVRKMTGDEYQHIKSFESFRADLSSPDCATT